MKEITYRVWVDIEEFNHNTESGVECDGPGGSVAEFDNYDKAYEFAARLNEGAAESIRNARGDS